MTEIAPSASFAAGASRELPRLNVRTWNREPRRVVLDRISRQMALFSRMKERLGVAAPEGALTQSVLREAELGCLDCATWRRCRAWLDGNAPDDDYRDFCPNEGLLGVLTRRDDTGHDSGRMATAES
jgi:uncharacterized protein DUF6455